MCTVYDFHMVGDSIPLPGSVQKALDAQKITASTVQYNRSPFMNDTAHKYYTVLKFPLTKYTDVPVGFYHDNTPQGFIDGFSDQVYARWDSGEESELRREYGLTRNKQVYAVWHQMYLLQKDIHDTLRRKSV